jgi:hypothetical protein
MKSNLSMLAMALSVSACATSGLAQDLGRVHFKTSCTPQAQEKFDRGVALVHSFYYPDSVQAFTEAAAADPQCAIAYWGIAISHRPNPLVLPLAAAALKNGLEAVEKGRAIGTKTERERDWLAAIEVYYKDYDKIDQTARGLAYERAMEQLAQKYPDDVEATVFYALALNETALPSDKTYAKLLKAGATLEKVARTLPDHPGVLHYIIHSYDYAPLAQRGLDAANKYARVAPSAPHALHMPAHIYALLQMGQEQRARQLVNDNGAIKKFGFEYLVGYTGLAAVPARFALERQAWTEAATLEPRGGQFPQAEAITYFARAMGLARSGDVAAAERNVAKLTELRVALEKANQSGRSKLKSRS